MKKILLTLTIAFSFFMSKAQLLSDFESWHNYTAGILPLTIPNGWNATDSLIGFYGFFTNPGGTFVSQVSKEMPGNAASATALRVTTKNQDSLPGFLAAGPMPCTASNSEISVDVNTGSFTFLGGTPYAINPDVATMWVMTNQVGGDSTSITILALDNSDGEDSLVSFADTILGAPINTFTQLTLPFKNYNPNFSTTQVRVIVNSSANFYIDATPAFANCSDGTYIVVDDIMISAPAGTKQYLLSEKVAAVYPTLMDNELHVNLKNDDRNKYQINITDLQGKKIRSFDVNNTFNSFDVSSLSKGNYIFSIMKDKKIVQGGKLSK